MAIPHIEIVEERVAGHIVRSTNRPATEKELDEAYRKYKEGKCDHSIFIDEHGWLYNFRECYYCGKGLGAI